MKKEFKTKWSLEEPNIASALKKNSNNTCSMNKCQNKLESPPDAGYGGLKICKNCYDKNVAPLLKQIKKELDREMVKYLEF